MTGQVLRRRMQDEVGAEVERAEVDGCRRGGVDDHSGRMPGGRLEIRHGQERVRRRFEPDEVDVVGRWTGLVELDRFEPPAAEFLPHHHTGAEVATFGQGNRLPGLEEREQQRESGRGARGEEERLSVRSTFECSQLPLCLDSGRVRVTGVEELPRLAVEVRPDAAPVHAHVARVPAGSGRRSSSFPMCASSGKALIDASAIPIVATPPAATAPDSKAPSSLEAEMNTISTALTRPRSSLGVTSATVVERILTLIMSTNP